MHKEKPKKKFNEIYLVLIVAIIIILFNIAFKDSPSKSAEKITEMIIDHHELSFASNGIIDNEKLEQIKSMNYEQLKDDLNANSDFCIYLEDDKGNIILAKSSDKLQRDELSCR